MIQHNIISCRIFFRFTTTDKVVRSRRMRWAWHVARMRDDRIQNFGRKSEGKRSHGRPRYRWEDNIKTEFREMRREGV
jgi:hypothetical protein